MSIQTFSMKVGGKRVPIGEVPTKPTTCNISSCVYILNGVCDDPRINKGNSDASCHKINNRKLLTNHLTRIT